MVRWLALAGALAAVAAAGCRLGGEGRASRLVIVPTESEISPELAAEVDARMRAVQVEGTAPRTAKVSMEVVQLSVECVDAASACHAAAGRALGADALLFARILPASESGKTIRVVVTLFDVPGRKPIQVLDHSYRGPDDALRRVRNIVRTLSTAKVPPPPSPSPGRAAQ